jgi:hypothetical protein
MRRNRSTVGRQILRQRTGRGSIHEAVGYAWEGLESRKLLSFSVALTAGALLQRGDVNASQTGGSQTETDIAINPTNPANLSVTSNGGGGNEFTANSTNAGTTFTTRTLGNIQDGLGGGSRFDGAATFDRFGNLHVIYIHRNAAQTQLDIVYARSTDGGANFGNVVVLATSGAGGVDKPWIAAGPDAQNLANDAVWVTYRSAANRIVVHGASVTGLGAQGAFTAATNVSDAGGGNYAVPAVGPDGELAITWQNPSGGQGLVNCLFDRDLNGLSGGVAFGGDTTATTSNAGGFDFIPATPDRSTFASPYVAYDRSGGAFNGRLYLAYADEIPDESTTSTSSCDGPPTTAAPGVPRSR